MQNVELLHPEHLPSTIRIERDSSNNSHWCFMHAKHAFSNPDYRACFSPTLLRELRVFARQTIDEIDRLVASKPGEMSHIVLASDNKAFNLGGDLALFQRLIQDRNREGLRRYAHECVDSIHLLQTRLHPSAHTIGLVEGDALGGGFELALACQTIVAERGAQLGFPEVLFGLFPGMGAYTLLTQRVSPKQAEDMMLNGRMYSAEQLHEMGIVDVLASKGDGVRTVHDIIRNNRRIAGARVALHQIRDGAHPVDHAELIRVTDIWVETALQLDEKSLRMMQRLVRAQLRRPDEPDRPVKGTAKGA